MVVSGKYSLVLLLRYISRRDLRLGSKSFHISSLVFSLNWFSVKPIPVFYYISSFSIFSGFPIPLLAPPPSFQRTFFITASSPFSI